MRRRAFIAVLAGAVFLRPQAVRAQAPAKAPRIGVLRPGALGDASLDAFLQALRELGYAEDQTISIDYRAAEGEVDRLPALASELIGLKVDLIVAEHSSAIAAAKRATGTIPIVMAASADPVGAGLIASLARPGGNVTGLSRVAAEAEGKRLAILKEALPQIRRVAFIWDPANRGLAVRFKAAEIAAQALGLELQSLEVRTPDQLRGALESAAGTGAGALVVPSPIASAYGREIVDFAVRQRLPLVYSTREFVDTRGALMSYGSSLTDSWRRAAVYVDKILKGATPADLPVEQPTKFELVVNLHTARLIGVTIPPAVLAITDEVIE